MASHGGHFERDVLFPSIFFIIQPTCLLRQSAVASSLLKFGGSCLSPSEILILPIKMRSFIVRMTSFLARMGYGL
eukprot:scaffold882_cov85-Skeletonema_marinoi.AAC.4